jgi:predicted Na+-dependent transporter
MLTLLSVQHIATINADAVHMVTTCCPLALALVRLASFSPCWRRCLLCDSYLLFVCTISVTLLFLLVGAALSVWQLLAAGLHWFDTALVLCSWLPLMLSLW